MKIPRPKFKLGEQIIFRDVGRNVSDFFRQGIILNASCYPNEEGVLCWIYGVRHSESEQSVKYILEKLLIKIIDKL